MLIKLLSINLTNHLKEQISTDGMLGKKRWDNFNEYKKNCYVNLLLFKPYDSNFTSFSTSNDYCKCNVIFLLSNKCVRKMKIQIQVSNFRGFHKRIHRAQN